MHDSDFLQPAYNPQVTVDELPPHNTGVLEGQRPEDFVAGKIGALPYEIVNSSGDWRNYQVRGEKQWYPSFDTMNCTSYANNNSAEIQLKFKTGYEFNFSDRAMGVLAGNTLQGNYLYKPADVGRLLGRVLEEDYPNDDGAQSWYEYHKMLPPSLRLIRFNESYEWVPTDKTSLKYHLRQAPIQMVIVGGALKHAVVLVHIDTQGYWYVDSYSPFIKLTTQAPSSALKVVVKPMSNSIFYHKQGSQEYGFAMPALSEDALKNLALLLGKPELIKTDGKIDFAQAKEVSGL